MSKNEETSLTIAGAMDSADKLMAVLEQDAQGEATAEEIREQMGSVEPRLEKIEVKHAGANLIVFPGGKPIQGEEGFMAVILASNFSNSKFEHAFDDPNRDPSARPECKSSDGIVPDEGCPSPKASNCASCPLNCSATNQAARDAAFAKDRDERCQNRLTLVVMVPGHSIPYILNLSPSSFKHFASYAQRVGGQSRFLLHEVVTQITFAKVGQYGHSEARFNKLGSLPKELREANAEAHKSYLGYLRRTATMDRTDEAEATAKAEATQESSSTEEAPL